MLDIRMTSGMSRKTHERCWMAHFHSAGFGGSTTWSRDWICCAKNPVFPEAMATRLNISVSIHAYAFKYRSRRAIILEDILHCHWFLLHVSANSHVPTAADMRNAGRIRKTMVKKEALPLNLYSVGSLMSTGLDPATGVFWNPRSAPPRESGRFSSLTSTPPTVFRKGLRIGMMLR